MELFTFFMYKYSDLSIWLFGMWAVRVGIRIIDHIHYSFNLIQVKCEPTKRRFHINYGIQSIPKRTMLISYIPKRVPEAFFLSIQRPLCVYVFVDFDGVLSEAKLNSIFYLFISSY